ncbi:MAG: hypothetical protein E5W90_12995 [Mesorhizobium sp.]|nr:MAG: hypothetical protein E5W90_12995 [Mesorhizobium sp.]
MANFITRFGGWALWRPKLFWAGLILPLTIVGIATITARAELGVRAGGFLLQVAGYVFVAIGLSGVVRELVDVGPLATIFGWVRGWWRDRPLLRRNVVVSATGTSTTSVSIGTAKIQANMDPNTPLEDRVAYLESAVELLRKEHGEMADAMRVGMKGLEAKLADEAAQRRKAEADLLRRIKGAFVDGIGYDILGIWFFVFGNGVGTFAPELAARIPW